MNIIFWVLLTLSILLLSTGSFFAADQPIALWIHDNLQTGPITNLFAAITVLGDSLWSLLLGLFLFIAGRGRNQRLAISGHFLMATVATSGIVVDIIKFISGRSRPALLFSEHIATFSFFRTEHLWTSFPSGHSATAWSIAMFLALLFPKWRHLSILFGVLVAASRVVLNYHYLSDVIIGSYLGGITSVLLYTTFFSSKLTLNQRETI